MNEHKTILSSSIALALGMASHAAQAVLTTSATLNFTLGTPQVVACRYGTTPPCVINIGNPITDIVGSYFVVDTNVNGIAENFEKTPIGSLNGIQIGTTQSASGSHVGSINGNENPNIDNPWDFFGVTGMHVTTSPITVVSDLGGGQMTLDFSGWNVIYGNDTPVPSSDIGNVDIFCSDAACSDGSSFTIDYMGHATFGGHTSTNYFLHLEGTVSSLVPVPAAAWLFGSGLAGLMGIARRRKAV